MAFGTLAGEGAGMKLNAPPRWLERLLSCVLESRSSEPIIGDLCEEYAEEQLPGKGYVRANLWYARQIAGFAATRIQREPRVKQLLLLTSVFALAAGVWLAVMENVLKHDGYAARTGMDVCIAVQGLMTLALVILNRPGMFRYLVTAGGLVMLWLGASSLTRMLRGPHFEGFVLVIGAALIVQGALTPLVMLRFRRN